MSNPTVLEKFNAIEAVRLAYEEALAVHHEHVYQELMDRRCDPDWIRVIYAVHYPEQIAAQRHIDLALQRLRELVGAVV